MTRLQAASTVSARDVDAMMGCAWFNGLSRAQRAYWLDKAWRRASPVYHLDAMSSAADAWETFKAARPFPQSPPTVDVTTGAANHNEPQEVHP